MSQLSDRLDISYPKIVYWMGKFDIPRRTRSESTYVRLTSGHDPYFIKKDLSADEKNLLFSGLMLFWAEGNKATKGFIQLANLDYRLLKLFVKFLRNICNVKEGKLRLYVRLHTKFDPVKAKSFWSKTLKIPFERIYIYKHIDRRSKTSKQWSEHGLATLQLCNIKLRKWLDTEIENIANNI